LTSSQPGSKNACRVPTAARAVSPGALAMPKPLPQIRALKAPFAHRAVWSLLRELALF